MKRIFVLVALLTAVSPLSFAQAELSLPFPVPALRPADSVSIYGDFREQYAGRSENRSDVRRYEFSVFSESKTFPVGNPGGLLTAVVVDKRVEAALSALLLDTWYQNLGEYELFKQYIEGRRCYSFRHAGLGLEFTFSLEKPDDAVLSQITAAYPDRPDVREDVRTHYQDNFVVRIYEAENIVNPGLSEITYDEALVMATLVGDGFQWLWGIHDGAEILFRITTR